MSSEIRIPSSIKSYMTWKLLCVLWWRLSPPVAAGLRALKNQTQNLILQLERLQYKSNSSLHRISTFKVRALIGKEWDPESWNGDVSETLMKLGQWDSNFWWVFFASGSSLPILNRDTSTPKEWDYCCSAWGNSNSLLWGSCHARQCWFSSGLTLPHFFASRLITRLKYQQDSKGEVQSGTKRTTWIF